MAKVCFCPKNLGQFSFLTSPPTQYIISWHNILKIGPLRLKWTPNDRKFDAESISAVKCTRKTIFKEVIEIEEYPIHSLLLGGDVRTQILRTKAYFGHLGYKSQNNYCFWVEASLKGSNPRSASDGCYPLMRSQP